MLPNSIVQWVGAVYCSEGHEVQSRLEFKTFSFLFFLKTHPLVKYCKKKLCNYDKGLKWPPKNVNEYFD